MHTAELADDDVGSQEEMLKDTSPEKQVNGSAPSGSSETPNKQKVKDSLEDRDYDAALDFWEPKPPKVLMQNPKDKTLELHSQIQLYASTEYAVSPL